FLISKPFLLLTAGFIIGTATSLYFLSPKNNSSAAITELTQSSKPDKINENDATKISPVNKENTPVINQPGQNKNDNTSAAIHSTNAVGDVINNNFVTPQTTERS